MHPSWLSWLWGTGLSAFVTQHHTLKAHKIIRMPNANNPLAKQRQTRENSPATQLPCMCSKWFNDRQIWGHSLWRVLPVWALAGRPPVLQLTVEFFYFCDLIAVQEAKAAVEETRALRARILLAEAAQKQARGMEMDYEEVIHLLEAEIAEMKSQLVDQPTHTKVTAGLALPPFFLCSKCPAQVFHLSCSL